MVKVKICGNTRIEDARLACNQGADMVGVIVKTDVPTPREIGIRRARGILETVENRVETVVVTTERDPVELEEISKELEPDFLQIHAEISSRKLREIGEKTGERIVAVCSIPPDPKDPESLFSRAEEISKAADMILLDTGGGNGGGTGKTHDWKISQKIAGSVGEPVILAGGLEPSNVKRAIEEVSPYGVDVASGIESAPGRKNPVLMKEFIQKAGG